MSGVCFSRILVAALAFGVSAAAIAATSYTVKKVSVPNPYVQAFWMNDVGRVVGNGSTTGPAFVTEKNGKHAADLSVFAATHVWALSINAADRVVGCYEKNLGEGSSFLHAFVADANGANALDLGTLGYAYSCAVDINDQGLITGYGSDDAGGNVAFVADAGNLVTRLGSWGGFVYPNSVNEVGWVVGQAQTQDGSSHAFLAKPPYVQLARLDKSFAASSSAIAINDKKAIVGDYVVPGTGLKRAFIKLPNADIRDLGTPAGAETYVNGINNAGTVIGKFWSASQGWVFFSCDTTCETYTDLTRVTALPADMQFMRLQTINKKGQILFVNSDNEFYLATPEKN